MRSGACRKIILNAYKELGYSDEQIASLLALPVFTVGRTRITPGTHILNAIRASAVRLRPDVARIEPEGVVYADGAQSQMDEIAAEIGARPQFLRHPTLLRRLLFGPLLSAQYRLDGPGKFDKAIDSIVGR
jgi:hypothetical protein